MIEPTGCGLGVCRKPGRTINNPSGALIGMLDTARVIRGVSAQPDDPDGSDPPGSQRTSDPRRPYYVPLMGRGRVLLRGP
jgi:hypothetical protein